jgi:hypothetical protein
MSDWKCSHGVTRCAGSVAIFMSAGARVVALAFLLVAAAGAQQTQTIPATPNSNAIMGFESLGTWSVSGIPLRPGFKVQSTTMRTQGSAAYSIANPPDLMQLTSMPISSTASALTGIGNEGALIDLDVLIPVEHNRVSPGWILAFVSSKSRGLHTVPLGFVAVNNHSGDRGGIYTTITFAIPPNVSSALKGATYSDLTFQFDVISLGLGTYLFDNLRVHSVPLVQSPTGTPPPPGYGGSVNLVVPGNAPVAQAFGLGPAQVPNGFHLKMGTVGTTVVQLELGLDGNAALTCMYGNDATDATDRSYIFNSCTGGFEPGDLVNANWVNMAIVNGDSTQQIRAQLALNPLGDMTGGGLIPPMPTFWGDADTCTPAPVPGSVVTTSSSCSNQTAEANQIIMGYFNQVNSANPAPNWIVPPVPEFALRRADGTPTNNLTGTPIPPGDPPFDTGGDLNPGGTFDAYWRLNGDLTPTGITGTDENTTHFDATFTAHGVLFGDDVDVVDVKVVADTDSGQTTPAYKAATSTGTLGLYVFGNEIPSGGFSVNPSTGFSVDPTFSQEYDLPPIQIWIFSITLGATANAELNAQGSAAVSGLDLSVIPSGSLGAHASGGINLGIASGSVDAKVNLVTLSTPITAQAKWVINTAPDICATELSGSLTGNLNLSSGGGEVDLDASFGPCPFCYTDSETLFKWGPLASENWDLFNDTLDVQFFGLPSSLCSFPVTVNIVSPTSGASLSSGLPITLVGSAKPNNSELAYTSTYNWTFTPGANASTAMVLSGGTSANPRVQFGPPTSGTSSSWTINMNANVTVNGNGGTNTTVSGTATSVPVTVTNLGNGVYISQIVSSTNGPGIPDSNGVVLLGNIPGTVTISGLVVGASGPLNTTFTTTDTNPITTMNASSTTPSAIWTPSGSGGPVTITMTTTAGGSTFGTTSVPVEWTVLY